MIDKNLAVLGWATDAVAPILREALMDSLLPAIDRDALGHRLMLLRLLDGAEKEARDHQRTEKERLAAEEDSGRP